jgi:hypothetical protein
MYRKLINALVLTEVSAHLRRNRKDRRKSVFFRASLRGSGIYETEKAGTCGILATPENPKKIVWLGRRQPKVDSRLCGAPWLTC